MSESRITAVHARQVLDSRGNPTVEADVHCGDVVGRASVPSGASRGRFEACELRDGDERHFGGDGVLRAVRHVREELTRAVIGLDAADQSALDAALCAADGTPAKSRLGANAILSVSLAAARAAANVRGLPLVRHLHELWCTASDGGNTAMSLPLPMINLISGGKHAGGQLDFQDYLAIPIGATSFSEALEWVVATYRTLGRLLRKQGYEGYLVGDEGGYGPQLPGNEAALSFVVQSIEAAGLRPGIDVAIGLDVAATHFYANGCYRLHSEENRRLTSAEMIDRLADWVDRYPIVSIEDGLAEDDWDGWQLLTEHLGDRIQILGDDLFTTQVARIEEGIRRGVANSVLIKLNQIGTLSETLQAISTAIKAGYRPVVSARSGETEDDFIAELAVATGAGQIKIGSIARSERLAKYNQLLRLEELLGAEAPFAGGVIVQPRR
jgi:enolase